MATPTNGQLRVDLYNMLKKAAKGEVKPEDGKIVIGMANQISNNLKGELKARELEIRLGKSAAELGSIGSLTIG